MFTLIILWIVLMLIRKACRPAQERKPSRKTRSVAAYQPSIRQLQADMKLRERQRREQERIWREQDRAMAQAEKARQRREQAEADIAFLTHQLDQISELLNEADTELVNIERKIAIDLATRSYDSEQKDRKTRERIQKKIMQYESRIHNLESRLSKARYTLTA